MKNLSLLCLLLLVLSCGSDEPDDAEPFDPSTLPNILMVIIDDVGVDAFPNYPAGDVKPNMPNVQALMDDGITYDNMWSYPLCAPTRASILTGKYGFRTNVLDVNAVQILPSEKTVQTYIGEEIGDYYETALIGKWHLSDEPNQPTEMGIGYFAGLLKGATASFDSWNFTENGTTSTSNEYITTKFTDLAIDWVDAQTSPWFCWLAYTAPHTPFHLPPVEMHSQGSLPTDQASIDNNPLPYYMAMLESADYELGRLLASMPAEELEQTLIVFLGDNGTTGAVVQAPFVSNRSKGSLHQGGVNVPMVIAGKGVNRKGQRETSLVSCVDLFSTIAEAAGASEKTYEDSQSFLGTFDQSGAGPRDFVYTEISDNSSDSGYAIRNDQYKLMVLENGNFRFYDLLDDPYEADNLLLGSGNLSPEQSAAKTALETEAARIRG